MILNGLYFFENTTSTGDSEIVGNTKGSILVLQVKCSGSFSFSVQGCADLDNNEFKSIAAIDMSDLSVVTSIESEGIFQADISGLRKVKLSVDSVSGGELTVYGIIKEG